MKRKFTDIIGREASLEMILSYLEEDAREHQGKIADIRSISNQSFSDEEIRKVFTCPKCENPMSIDEDGDGLACPICGLKFPTKQIFRMLMGENEYQSY
uniref:Uncharacterized protein n=1 Tax=viral metagenome TaxID=1070528 RepID=A0A6M3LDP7_9ZZZZ